MIANIDVSIYFSLFAFQFNEWNISKIRATVPDISDSIACSPGE